MRLKQGLKVDRRRFFLSYDWDGFYLINVDEFWCCDCPAVVALKALDEDCLGRNWLEVRSASTSFLVCDSSGGNSTDFLALESVFTMGLFSHIGGFSGGTDGLSSSLSEACLETCGLSRVRSLHKGFSSLIAIIRSDRSSLLDERKRWFFFQWIMKHAKRARSFELNFENYFSLPRRGLGSLGFRMIVPSAVGLVGHLATWIFFENVHRLDSNVRYIVQLLLSSVYPKESFGCAGCNQTNGKLIKSVIRNFLRFWKSCGQVRTTGTSGRF